MVIAKSSPFDVKFEFGTGLTDTAMAKFPMAYNADALPHEPPKDWIMKQKWVYLFWIDELPPPSLQGLEGAAFTPFDFDGSDETMKKLQETAFLEKYYNMIVKGRANFVLEDYCHIPRTRGTGAG